MIDLASFKTAFKDYRYYYGSAPIGTALPYLVAVSTGSDNFAADSLVYAKKFGLRLDYYSLIKDETEEAKIETILDGLGLIWDKEESYEEDQKFFLTTYSFWR